MLRANISLMAAAKRRLWISTGYFVPGETMQAALQVEFAAKLRGRMPTNFAYRGVQPLFEGSEFTVNANETASGMETWTANSEGQPTMKGTATW